MGVYSRFKRNPDGFRALVELLEATPASRRQKMIEVGQQEDPDFTARALQYVMTFEDILKLPEGELAEVVAKSPPRMTAYALNQASPEVQQHFIRHAPPVVGAEIREYLEVKVGLREVGAGQLKMVEIARQLERRGLVKTKRIPV